MSCSAVLIQELVQKQKQEMNLRSRIFCWEVKKDPGAGDDVTFITDDIKCPECGYEAEKENIANLMSDISEWEDYLEIHGKKLVCPQCETYSVVIASAHLLGADVWEEFELLGPRETIVQIRQLMKEEKLKDPVSIKQRNPGAYYSGLMWFGGWAELYRKAYMNKWNAPKYLISDLMLDKVSALTAQGMKQSEIRAHIKREYGINLSGNQIIYRMYKNSGARRVPERNRALIANSKAFREVEELLHENPHLSGSQICAKINANMQLRTVNNYKKIILETVYWERFT